MKSIIFNKINDNAVQNNLSVITQITSSSKKVWKKLFSSNESNESTPICTSPIDLTPNGSISEIEHTSSSDSAESPSSSQSLKKSRKYKKKTTECKFSKELEPDSELKHKRTKSMDSINSVSNSLKRIQLTLLPNKSSSSLLDEQVFDPVAPEPILPTLVDWLPEKPISPPPWELDENEIVSSLHRQDSGSSNLSGTTYGSKGPTAKTFDNLFEKKESLSRRSSCPPMPGQVSKISSLKMTPVQSRASSPSSTFESNNDILHVTQQHTTNISLLKHSSISDRKPTFVTCQKIKAKAAEAAEHGEVFQSDSIYSSIYESHLKHLYIPNVFDPESRQAIIRFTSIKPRKYRLYRKTSWKREAKALLSWHHALEERLVQPCPVSCLEDNLPKEKFDSCLYNRRFIIREFFTTEVTFWNQLYYSKVVFYDALAFAITHKLPKTKVEYSDVYANLFDLMQFSAKLINRLRRFKIEDIPSMSNTYDDMSVPVDCHTLHIGKHLLEVAEDLVVFLRCAVDYQANRKLLDSVKPDEDLSRYKRRLSLKKETRQFTLYDFLIIPIQRVARYRLLIEDIIKHTPSDHPDCKDLVRAYHLITSLCTAMDLIQKKQKK